MNDGVGLVTDIYRRQDGSPGPVLLLRTPYGRAAAETDFYAHPQWYADKGFGVVVQDVRGRGDSDGEFRILENEASDGRSTFRWILEQTWCNGRIGTYGSSYSGAVQLLAADSDLPHAMALTQTPSMSPEAWIYRGGAFCLSLAISWMVELGRETARRAGDEEAIAAFEALPSEERLFVDPGSLPNWLSEGMRKYVPFFEEWLSWANEPPQPRALWQGTEAPPCLHVGGWYDPFLEDSLSTFNRFRKSNPRQELRVFPWSHVDWGPRVGDLDFGSLANNRIDDLQIDFFRRMLTSAPAIEGKPPVRYFLMGANTWESADSWPPETSPFRLNLRPASRDADPQRLVTEETTTAHGRASLSSAASPRLEVRGGRSWSPSGRVTGPRRQVASFHRPDVLVYDTDEMEVPIQICGNPQLRVFVSTDADAFDLSARLLLVERGESSINVSDAYLRWTENAEGITQLDMPLSPTAFRCSAGDRIRLELSLSAFPIYDALIVDDVEWRLQILHEPRHASFLVVPVVDPSSPLL